MHKEAFEFIEESVKDILSSHLEILEIGSLDVNSTNRRLNIRQLKYPPGYHYTGIDIKPGPGVDVICSSHDLVSRFGMEKFHIVLCCEMLEHDPEPNLTAIQIFKALRTNGRLYLTTTGLQRGYHNPPHYWNFSKEGIEFVFKMFSIEGIIENSRHQDIYLKAKKTG